MAIRPRLQDAAKARLVKSKLLLDCLGGEADLPADLPLAGRATPLDQRQLDAVGLVQTEPVEIGGRQVLAAGACRPELIYCALYVDCHGRHPHNGEPTLRPAMPIYQNPPLPGMPPLSRSRPSGELSWGGNC